MNLGLNWSSWLKRQPVFEIFSLVIQTSKTRDQAAAGGIEGTAYSKANTSSMSDKGMLLSGGRQQKGTMDGTRRALFELKLTS